MKMPIIAFMLVLILLGGMSSSADDAMSELVSDSGAEASLVALNVATVDNDATTTTHVQFRHHDADRHRPDRIGGRKPAEKIHELSLALNPLMLDKPKRQDE